MKLSDVSFVLSKHWDDLLIVGLLIAFWSDSLSRAFAMIMFAGLCLIIGVNMGVKLSMRQLQEAVDRAKRLESLKISRPMMQDVLALKPGQAVHYTCKLANVPPGEPEVVEFIVMESDDFRHVLSLAKLKPVDVVKGEKSDG